MSDKEQVTLCLFSVVIFHHCIIIIIKQKLL